MNRKRQRSPQPTENRGVPKAKTTAQAIRDAQEQLIDTTQKLQKAKGRRAELLLQLQVQQQKEIVILRQQGLQELQTRHLHYSIITPHELLRVKAATFALLTTTNLKGHQTVQPECTGFFISPKLAVTARHALPASKIGDIFTARFKGSASGPNRDITVNVVKVIPDLDLAFLSTAVEQPYIPLSKLDPDLLPQLKVGLASFAFSLQENDVGTVRILPGTILDVDLATGTLEHSCGCIPGNSGAALIVAEGEVVAMHTDGDNRLKKLTEKATLSDIREQIIEVERGFVMGGHGILACRIQECLPE